MRLCLSLALCLVSLALLAPAAAAEPGLVIDYEDSNTPTTNGQLRHEINQADPGETVVIQAGIDPAVTEGEIAIDEEITIVGQGADETRIDAAFSSRIFRIYGGDEVTIQDVWLSGGLASEQPVTANGANGENGGAVLVEDGVLTLERVRVWQNHAGDGATGITGSTGSFGGTGGAGGAGGLGGAIHSTDLGRVTVIDSLFHSNTAGTGGTGGTGGESTGMINVSGPGGVGGLAGSGGAISSEGGLTVINSTFFDNRAGTGGTGGSMNSDNAVGGGGMGGMGGSGGAIHQEGMGSISLTNVTIAFNDGGPGGGGGDGTPDTANGMRGTDGTGGGTYIDTGPSPILIVNTIWSENEGDPTVPPGSTNFNCGGSGGISGTQNISYPADPGCPAGFSTADPLLGPLAENGGPTRTMALGAGSPALDQIPATSTTDCPATDQRGVSRPQGAACDIGAFERECTTPSNLPGCPPLPVPPATTPPSTVPRKKCKKGRKLVRRKGKLRCKKRKRKK